MHALAHEWNNFDGLRLLAAAAVIFGHAFVLLGRPRDVPILAGFEISRVGLFVFFIISGYLVTASWTSKPNLPRYLAARCLRILPALVIVVTITIVVIGPLTTTLPPNAYFRSPTTTSYWATLWLYPHYFLPGVFQHLPYPRVLNGSLWTLPVEFSCYLLVPLLLAIKRSRIIAVATALGVSVWFATAYATTSPYFYGVWVADGARLWSFFWAGCLLRLVGERHRVIRTDAATALTACYLILITLRPGWTQALAWTIFPYVVLAIGLASTPGVRNAARYGDFSYGAYVWAFPIQQLTVWRFGRLPLPADLAVVAALTSIAAVLSWHLIERPALRLRRRLRGRPLKVARLSSPVRQRSLHPSSSSAGRHQFPAAYTDEDIAVDAFQQSAGDESMRASL